MALSNTQYDSIMRIYEERQRQNRYKLEQRRAYVHQHIPEFEHLEQMVASTSIQQGKLLLEGDETALERLRDILQELHQTKCNLLQQAGLAPNYLEPIYHCCDCQDKGYIDGKKCHCFVQAEIEFLYQQSNIGQLLEEAYFNKVSDQYYQGEDLIQFQNTLTSCYKFVENFALDYQNLFFYGTVGTGKSFLSGCIARELIEKGYSVIYFSSCGLFKALSHSTFDNEWEETQGIHQNLYQCDLLIIDDLGTELTNQFVNSQLFSCLNERHIRKKATIISTNLSLQELQLRYSDRIFSRIISHYSLCKLSGPDIRLYKKRANHS